MMLITRTHSTARIIKAITLTVALGLSAGLSGCQRANVPVTQSQVAAAEVTRKHVCGAATKSGKACRNPVTKDGERCHLHTGAPTLAANPCYRPKGSAPVEDCYYEDGDTTRPDAGKP